MATFPSIPNQWDNSKINVPRKKVKLECHIMSKSMYEPNTLWKLTFEDMSHMWYFIKTYELLKQRNQFLRDNHMPTDKYIESFRVVNHSTSTNTLVLENLKDARIGME